MTPVVALGIVAGAAGAVYLYKKRSEVKGQVPGALPGVVNQLTKGKSYAALITVAAQDGRAGHQAVGSIQPDEAAATLKAGLEQVGFKALSAPVLRNAKEADDFIHKNPSIWVCNLQWTKEGNPGALPGYILNIDYVLLPIQ